MFQKVHIVKKLNAVDDVNVKRICSCIETICETPVKGGRSYVVDKAHIDNQTLVIAVGGDGTMLEAMRIAHKHRAVATGINLGTIGFLTDFSNDQEQLLGQLDNAIHENNHPIEQRIGLTYDCHDKNGPYHYDQVIAFNEFVISNKLSDHLIKYTLFIGDRCAGTHRANALIIGTPTGSTAYTLSAGGGLMLPSMEALQIVSVAPVSLTSRPIIVPSNEEVRVSIETQGDWILKADGATIGTFKNDHFVDTQVVITQCQQKVRILHSKNWSYFNMLTQKLGWKSN